MIYSAEQLERRRYLAGLVLRVIAGFLLLVGLYIFIGRFSSAGMGYSGDMGAALQYHLWLFVIEFVRWLAVPSALALLHRRIARWIIQVPKPSCPGCGYDISEDAPARCPECGMRLRDDD